MIHLKLFLNNFNDLNINLKWPNDVLIDGKKVAGLLLEVKNLLDEIKTFIIGIGLNVNEEFFNADIQKATSLRIETKSKICLENLLIQFIENFYKQIQLINRKSDLMTSWTHNSFMIGRKIKFKKLEDEVEQKGIVENIEKDGALKILFEGGKKEKFYSGEVSLIYD